MLCDSCKNNEANVFIKKLVDGVLKEEKLCSSCAASVAKFSVDFNEFKEDIFSNLSDMLAGFSDVVKVDETDKIPPCKECKMSYGEFQRNGRLGCGACYEAFRDKLTPLMMRLQGAVQHAGKIPTGMEKQSEKKRLKKELKQAVDTEEYERAAVIRDRIRTLEEEENAL